MQNPELFKEFKSLKTQSETSNAFDVIPIHNTNHKLGISKEGYPKFFVCTDDGICPTKNTYLEILSVEYNLPCTFVSDNEQTEKHQYSVITLRSKDESLQSDFIDIFVLMLSRLKAIPTKKEIAMEVENLISIFTAMKCPRRKPVQGLWAELLVIERSNDPETLVKAWHQEPNAKYDFTLGRDKIEVKSTSGEERKHHFSLDQLNPTKHSRLVIASTIVRESGQGNGGCSVRDLYNKICPRISSVEQRLRLYEVIVETLGAEFQSADNLFFDYVSGCDSLKYYDYRDVPGVDKESLDIGVSSVGFDSTLPEDMDINSSKSHFDGYDSVLFKCTL